MTLDQMAAISNIAASLAVVLTLVFIGLQLRQNAHLTRMAAAQTSAQLLAENLGRVVENADFAALLVREPHEDAWNDVELLRVTNFLSASFRHYEVLHTHRRHGIFEEELWEGAEARLKESLTNPRIREWWLDSRPFYARSFVAYVDQLHAQASAAAALENENAAQ